MGRIGSEYGLPVAVYMKYSANQGCISSFVVGRAGSEYGLPVAVIYNAASKATSAEPPPRWAIGTGQMSCLQFRSGPIARLGGGGIIPFGSASTTLYLLCPTGHASYMKEQVPVLPATAFSILVVAGGIIPFSTFVVAGGYCPVCYIKSIKNQVVFIMPLPIQGGCVLLKHLAMQSKS